MITDGAPRVFASCMTAADAAQVNGDSASGKAAAEKKAEGRCAVKSYTIAGSTVEYTLVCGERTIRSRTVFHGDNSRGNIDHDGGRQARYGRGQGASPRRVLADRGVQVFRRS